MLLISDSYQQIVIMNITYGNYTGIVPKSDIFIKNNKDDAKCDMSCYTSIIFVCVVCILCILLFIAKLGYFRTVKCWKKTEHK